MSNKTLSLDDRLYQYLLDHSVRESQAMRELRELTVNHEWAQMQISPEQGQFMMLLTELIGANRAIEIGTFTGYSALALASALPEDGKLICCDISQGWTNIGIPFWEQAGVRSRIDLRIAPALNTLDTLIEKGKAETFDLAFIDADKTNYLHYYDRCMTLIRTGGLMLFDNVLWGGAVADPDVNDEDTVALRELNDKIHKDERVSMSMIPVGDGLTLVRKR